MNDYGYQQPQQPYGGEYPPSYPSLDLYKRPLKMNANVIGLAVTLITACMYLFAWPMRQILYFLIPATPDYMLDFVYEIAYMVIYVLSFLTPCIVAIRWLHMPSYIAFPLRVPKTDILICAIFIGLGARIAGNVLVEMVTNVVYNTTGLIPTSPESSIPTDIPSIIVYFFSVAVMPAIFEEGMFRGIALQSLRRFGDGFALVTSSALFALMHGNLIQAAYSFPLGLVMGYFVLRTGSIWAGVLIHFMNNAFVVGIEFLDMIALDSVTNSVWMAFLGFSLLGSIIAVIYLKSRYGALLYVRPSNYPVATRKKYQWFFSSIFVILSILIAIVQTAGYLEGEKNPWLFPIVVSVYLLFTIMLWFVGFLDEKRYP